MSADEKRARELSYRYLAIRPRSKAEVVRYLGGKGFTEDIVSAVILTLEGYGYLDDAKFASGWARQLVGTKGLSRRAVGYELRRKGISEINADAAVEGLSDDETGSDDEVALRVARKKAESLAGLETEKARRRLVSYLQRRGFSYGVISGALRALNKE